MLMAHCHLFPGGLGEGPFCLAPPRKTGTIQEAGESRRDKLLKHKFQGGTAWQARRTNPPFPERETYC